jgi:hypothetical protein
MARIRFRARFVSACAVGVLAFAVATSAAAPKFEAAKMIIEYNSSAQDIGVQFFLDAEEWQSIKILDPRGVQIFSAQTTGTLLEQGGGTELFLESVEPALDELPLEEFFARFPEGQYKFIGRLADGSKMTTKVTFTDDVPAGPVVTNPPQPGGGNCPQGVAIPAVIGWEPVTESIEGEPIDIVGYEVIVEHEDQVFDVHLDADATQVTVPAEFLADATDYVFEVLAIESGGNQTITEGCFTTAN